MKPMVGVSAAWSDETFSNAEITSDFHYVAASYTNAIYCAGGTPFILAFNTMEQNLKEMAEIVIEKIDALLISGGGDVGINTAYATKSTLIEQQRRRYEFESLLIKSAWDRDIPVMGICRGHQMIAEVLGGSIKGDFIKGHTADKDSVDVRHKIYIPKGSRLGDIVKSKEWVVNSFHRQAVCAVPDGMEITARSEDGIIEAIEAVNKKFFMGFQFHPELLLQNDDTAKKVFRAFMDSVSGVLTV